MSFPRSFVITRGAQQTIIVPLISLAYRVLSRPALVTAPFSTVTTTTTALVTPLLIVKPSAKLKLSYWQVALLALVVLSVLWGQTRISTFESAHMLDAAIVTAAMFINYASPTALILGAVGVVIAQGRILSTFWTAVRYIRTQPNILELWVILTFAGIAIHGLTKMSASRPLAWFALALTSSALLMATPQRSRQIYPSPHGELPNATLRETKK